MSNSFLSSLQLLDANSVTNGQSLGVYVQNNQTPTYVPATVLQSLKGTGRASIIGQTTTYSPGFNTAGQVTFDYSLTDPLSVFNANSTSGAQILFTGWIRAQFSMSNSYDGGTDHRCHFTKNSSFFVGGLGTAHYNNAQEGYTIYTAPFTVTSGDEVGVWVHDDSALQTNPGETWLQIIPLEIN